MTRGQQIKKVIHFKELLLGLHTANMSTRTYGQCDCVCVQEGDVSSDGSLRFQWPNVHGGGFIQQIQKQRNAHEFIHTYTRFHTKQTKISRKFEQFYVKIHDDMHKHTERQK